MRRAPLGRAALAHLISGGVLFRGQPGSGPWALARDWQCDHCDVGGGFEEFLKPLDESGPHSDVHFLWPTHVEVIPVTEDVGGWEPPSFHERLAREALRGRRVFQDHVVPGLPRDHDVRRTLERNRPGALNDAFSDWQRSMFGGSSGNVMSPSMASDAAGARGASANTSWPEMCDLPEYGALRRIVDRFSRRYLVRSGMAEEAARVLNYSLSSWVGVHGPGEFTAPHVHTGEYHAGIFYAQAGPRAGKLRISDPRGSSPPFGHAFTHTPRSGELVLFPSWVGHMATVTAPAPHPKGEGDSGKEEPPRVAFHFNIGPAPGPLPCNHWHSDPTADARFMRTSPLSPEVLGL